jgi:hypothetical protein
VEYILLALTFEPKKAETGWDVLAWNRYLKELECSVMWRRNFLAIAVELCGGVY